MCMYRLDFDDDLLNNNWTFGSTIYFIESRQKSGCETDRERKRESQSERKYSI